MSQASEIIVIASPFLFGLSLWIAKELYNSMKGDLTDLKKSSYVTNSRLEKHETKIDNIDHKVTGLCKTITDVQKTTHEIDKRTGNTVEMTHAMQDLQNKLSEHEANYGKIMIILKKVVHIVTSRKVG